MHISVPVYKNIYSYIITQVFFHIDTLYVQKWSNYIFRESDRPHIKYDEKSENNVLKYVCV